jgi:hypothetical protein
MTKPTPQFKTARELAVSKIPPNQPLSKLQVVKLYKQHLSKNTDLRITTNIDNETRDALESGWSQKQILWLLEAGRTLELATCPKTSLVWLSLAKTLGKSEAVEIYVQFHYQISRKADPSTL